MTPSLAHHDPAHSSVDPNEGPPSEPARLSGESTDNGSANGGNGDVVAVDDPAPPDADTGDGDGSRRTIKRYSNRKLYDTRQSRYVTLLQIAEMVRAGEDVQIIDNATKEDKTDVTLALIISEELKARPRAIPLATLKALIRHRGGKLLTQLRESPIGRLMPREDGMSTDHDPSTDLMAEAPPNAEDSHVSKEQPGGLRRTLEQWQHTIDDRIRAVVPHFSALQELQGEVQQLSKRLEELEKRLAAPRE